MPRILLHSNSNPSTTTIGWVLLGQDRDTILWQEFSSLGAFLQLSKKSLTVLTNHTKRVFVDWKTKRLHPHLCNLHLGCYVNSYHSNITKLVTTVCLEAVVCLEMPALWDTCSIAQSALHYASGWSRRPLCQTVKWFKLGGYWADWLAFGWWLTVIIHSDFREHTSSIMCWKHEAIYFWHFSATRN